MMFFHLVSFAFAYKYMYINMYSVTVYLFGGLFLGGRGGGVIKLFIDTRRAVNKVKTFYNDLVAISIFFDMAK